MVQKEERKAEKVCLANVWWRWQKIPLRTEDGLKAEFGRRHLLTEQLPWSRAWWNDVLSYKHKNVLDGNGVTEDKGLFLICFLCFYSDGHHIWETEAKAERDAMKPVSNTCHNIFIPRLDSETAAANNPAEL